MCQNLCSILFSEETYTKTIIEEISVFLKTESKNMTLDSSCIIVKFSEG